MNARRWTKPVRLQEQWDKTHDSFPLLACRICLSSKLDPWSGLVRYGISCTAFSSNQFAFVARNLADKFYLYLATWDLSAANGSAISPVSVCREARSALLIRKASNNIGITWIHASIICC